MSQQALRTEDTATKSQNLQKLPLKNIADINLYIAALILYYHKSSLIFYNNDKEIFSNIKIKEQKARMPKRRQEESEEIWDERLAEWDAIETAAASMIEMKLKENHMIQKYYTDKILSQYVKKYQRCMTFVNKVILQKNNNDSHDTFTRNNYAARYKRRYNIESLIYLVCKVDTVSYPLAILELYMKNVKCNKLISVDCL